MSKRSLHCELLEKRHLLSATAMSGGDVEAVCASEPQLDERAVLAPLSSTTPAVDFFRLEPLGSLVSASQGNAGSITEPATDEIDFTFFAEAGELVGAIVTPDTPAAILTIEYVEGSGVSATASAPGGTVVLAPTPLAADGTVTLRVTSTTTTNFTLDIYRNAALEAAVGESSSTNRVELDASLINVGGNRYAGIGGTSLDPTQTVLYSEDFSGTTGFSFEDLWHTSNGRATDGQANHAGDALYFGQAELAADYVGTLNWQAELDATNNNLWESTVNNASTTEWAFGSASVPGTAGSASNLAGVDEWYTFGPTATMVSLHDSRGDTATKQDVSWELTFRPRDFTGTHVLFETGGNGFGTAFLLINNTLEFRVQSSDDATERVVRTFSFDAISDLDKFHHVVATVHPDSTAAANAVRLYVNGVEVGSSVSATGVLDDWDGGDDAGLGAANSAFPDDDDTVVTGNFDGDIAGLRYYENRLLNQGEVKANFDNLVNDFPYRTGNYDTGVAVTGDATSPAAGIALTGSSEFTLSFNTLIEVEDAEEPFELMQVVVRDTTTMVEQVILDRFDGGLPIDTNGQWAPIEADLSGFAGQTVQILFRFDSGDETENAFEGWWVDDLLVTRSDNAPTTDDDQFSIDLTGKVGQEIDILLAGQQEANYSGQTLELRNADGSVLLATGVVDPVQAGTSATNFDLGILGYEVQTDGVHTIRVLSDAGTVGDQYTLAVTDSVSFEAEPNATGDPLRNLDSTATGLGFLRSTSVQQYTSRAAFDSDHSSLIFFEDFEGGIVDDDDLQTFAGPLDSSTSNSAFPLGITPGLTISGGALPGGNIALVGPDFFDLGEPGSKVVGADTFSENTELNFSAGITAVGLDIFGEGDVLVSALDSNSVTIGSATVSLSPTGVFFGIATNTDIDRLRIAELGSGSGELIDNVAFGIAGITPEPDQDLYQVNLTAGQEVQITTSTPLDDPSNSPLNDLDPLLAVSGPGIPFLSDSNSAADGKNAELVFTAAQAGVYTIFVLPESGQGEYVVAIGGDSVAGDFQQDGDVDGADFLEWQRGFGATYDANDLTDWQTNYGTGASSSLLASVSAVREPFAPQPVEAAESANTAPRENRSSAASVLGLSSTEHHRQASKFIASPSRDFAFGKVSENFPRIFAVDTAQETSTRQKLKLRDSDRQAWQEAHRREWAAEFDRAFGEFETELL